MQHGTNWNRLEKSRSVMNIHHMGCQRYLSLACFAFCLFGKRQKQHRFRIRELGVIGSFVFVFLFFVFVLFM